MIYARTLVGLACAFACRSQPAVELPQAASASDAAVPDAAIAAVAVPDAAAVVPDAPPPPPWRFAVLSDLHLPNRHHKAVARVMTALVGLGVRFVVITGDSTNGQHGADHPLVETWWKTVATALAPLRTAGIAVLPVAGNHDSYTPGQRAAYSAAFRDLDAWAAPLTVNARRGRGLGGRPFSYSVDVDGVHLTLAHVVDQAVDKDVLAFIADDLAASASARHRLVFGHVPIASVMASPNRQFMQQFGPTLESGKAAFYIAGHEHLTWDETLALPAGGALRQVMTGCSSGSYQYGPTLEAMRRAGCTAGSRPGRVDVHRCKMPNGGAFEIARDKHGRLIQHELLAFTVFTVDGDRLDVAPMSVDDTGQPRAFYLADP